MQATAAIVRELSAVFRDKLFIEVPAADTDLIDSGLLDSLQLVQLLLHVEQDLGYRIPLDEIDLDDLRSLERLARVIAARPELTLA
jgi:methoxymalonate biosynthesis acyl carrier protein